MAIKVNRPGGQLTNRPLYFYWVVDCSGSMYGEKIGSVNQAIQSVIPDMLAAADANPNAQLLVRALKFSSGAAWVDQEPIAIEDYEWNDLDADGLTDLGDALDLLSAEMTMPPMPERALPPVIVLLSDGAPTSEYRQQLVNLQNTPWGRKAVKIAIAIGRDASEDMLEEFTGNSEAVLHANNADMLVKMIRWASTVAAQVSAPASIVNDGSNTTLPMLNLNTIPEPDDNDVW